jgi:hypothetical protein
MALASSGTVPRAMLLARTRAVMHDGMTRNTTVAFKTGHGIVCE